MSSDPRSRWSSAVRTTLSLVLSAAVGVALATPARATAPGPEAPGSAVLSGEVLQVQPERSLDTARHTGAGRNGRSLTLVRLPGGQLTPVTGLDDVPSGAAADITVQIPRSLEDAVERSAGTQALDDAREQPAPADGSVARVLAAVAARRDVPLPALTVQVTPVRATTTADPRPGVRTASAGQSAAAAATDPAPAPQRLTVVVAGVNGYAATAYSDPVITSMISSVSAYWSGQSGTAISVTRSGPVTRYTSSISCADPGALWTEAATRAGFHPVPGAHLVVLLPLGAYSAGFCSYGLGTVGASVSDGGLLYVADTSWPALAHELGHNMSLLHANELTCGASAADTAFDASGAPISSSCAVTEYGDGLDVMGLSALDDAGGLSSIGLERLGVLPASRVQRISATGVTQVTLPALSAGPAGTGVRAASVADPRTHQTYYLENRQPSGQDQYGWQGLSPGLVYQGRSTAYGLRVLKQGLDGASVLLDPTPSPDGTFDPAAVVASGSTFVSASGGVRITATQNADGTVTARTELLAAGHSPGQQGDGNGAGLAIAVVTASAPAIAATTSAAKVSVRVTAAGVPVVTGTVEVHDASGQTLATGVLSAGRAQLRVPSSGPGTHALTVAYRGSGSVAAGTSSVSLVVGRYAGRIQATVVRSTVAGRTVSSVVVTVSSAGGVPSGSVQLLGIRSAPLASAVLEAGSARLVAPAGTARQTVRVVYGGSPTVAPVSSLALTLR